MTRTTKGPRMLDDILNLHGEYSKSGLASCAELIMHLDGVEHSYTNGARYGDYEWLESEMSAVERKARHLTTDDARKVLRLVTNMRREYR